MSGIEPCPKCKKRVGYTWHYATDGGMTNGWGECDGCGDEFGTREK